MLNRIPFVLSIFSIVLGVSIAILFGINEDIFKGKIKEDLSKSAQINKILDPQLKSETLKKEQSKNWRYYQRFHFHSTGIGAISIGALLLLSFSLAPRTLTRTSAYMISIGGALYPFVWLLAGLFGPLIGREQAKEKFALFGYMGGLYLFGLLILLYIVGRYPLQFKLEKN